MKTVFLILFLVVCFLPSFCQDTIFWQPQYRLHWDDFKALSDPSKKYDAISYTGLTLLASYQDNKLTYAVKSFFLKNKSWAKTSFRTRLNHEQGHFDITEIYARKLRQAIKSYALNPEIDKEELERMLDSIDNERKKMNAEYDKETDFSRNSRIQLQWNSKIQNELNKLSEFGD